MTKLPNSHTRNWHHTWWPPGCRTYIPHLVNGIEQMVNCFYSIWFHPCILDRIIMSDRSKNRENISFIQFVTKIGARPWLQHISSNNLVLVEFAIITNKLFNFDICKLLTKQDTAFRSLSTDFVSWSNLLKI